MGSKQWELPRHKRPLWEIFVFAAALLGLMALATQTSVGKMVLSEGAEPPSAAADFTAP